MQISLNLGLTKRLKSQIKIYDAIRRQVKKCFYAFGPSSSVNDVSDKVRKRRIVDFRRCKPTPKFSPDDDDAVSNDAPGSDLKKTLSNFDEH